MKYSIKNWIIVFSFLLLTMSLVGNLLFHEFFGRDIYINQQKNRMEEIFLNMVEDYSDSAKELEKLIQSIDDMQNIRVTICDKKRIYYASDRKTGIRNIYNADKNKLMGIPLSMFREEPKTIVTYKKATQEKRLRLTGKFTYHGKERYVRLVYHMNPFGEITDYLNRTNLLVSLAVWLLGIILAIIFARWIHKPIDEIKNTAARIACLDFDQTLIEPTKIHELNSLQKSVNEMSIQLNEAINKLTLANHQLKDEVLKQKKLEDMRKSFISNVSHEMKTPLYLLSMYSENLKDECTEEERDFYCETIMEETMQLDKMVKNLLDMSSIENGLLKMKWNSFSFSDFLQNCIDKMKIVMNHANVEVEIEKDIWIKGDEYYLEQAVRNLIANAARFTEAGGEIKVSLESRGDECILLLYNQGECIKEEEKDSIWESFYRVDKSRTPTKDGNVGLGLYIVKTIINAHYGECGVRNEEQGVTFWIKIKKISQ